MGGRPPGPRGSAPSIPRPGTACLAPRCAAPAPAPAPDDTRRRAEEGGGHSGPGEVRPPPAPSGQLRLSSPPPARPRLDRKPAGNARPGQLLRAARGRGHADADPLGTQAPAAGTQDQQPLSRLHFQSPVPQGLFLLGDHRRATEVV